MGGFVNAHQLFGGNMRVFLGGGKAFVSQQLLDRAEIGPGIERHEKFVELDTLDAESLLVEWLSELSYWAEIEMLIFHEFKMESVSPTHLKATLYGTRVKQLEKHIKAVTYHNLEIVQTEKGLTATVVFDV